MSAFQLSTKTENLGGFTKGASRYQFGYGRNRPTFSSFYRFYRHWRFGVFPNSHCGCFSFRTLPCIWRIWMRRLFLWVGYRCFVFGFFFAVWFSSMRKFVFLPPYWPFLDLQAVALTGRKTWTVGANIRRLPTSALYCGFPFLCGQFFSAPLLGFRSLSFFFFLRILRNGVFPAIGSGIRESLFGVSGLFSKLIRTRGQSLLFDSSGAVFSILQHYDSRNRNNCTIDRICYPAKFYRYVLV